MEKKEITQYVGIEKQEITQYQYIGTERQEITQFIINSLGNHQTQNKIIESLCETYGITWTDAEKLVKIIQSQYAAEIRHKQSPLIIAIGIVSFFAGLGLIGFGIYYLFTFPQQNATQMARSVRGLIGAVGAVITGFGLVIGSIVGTWKQIQSIFEDKENR